MSFPWRYEKILKQTTLLTLHVYNQCVKFARNINTGKTYPGHKTKTRCGEIIRIGFRELRFNGQISIVKVNGQSGTRRDAHNGIWPSLHKICGTKGWPWPLIRKGECVLLRDIKRNLLCRVGLLLSYIIRLSKLSNE